MLLFALAYLGGVLTIVSPCVLPVLPFVFARVGQSFARSVLPMLAGMALTFAIVGTLAAVAGGWAVETNRFGRGAAIVLLAVFGVALLFPGLAERLARPLVSLGARVSQPGAATPGDRPALRPAMQPSMVQQPAMLSSALLGVATGPLGAPWAGPILGLILTGLLALLVVPAGVRFRIPLDGAPPGDSHGSDVDARGRGIVDGQRLYQLVRQDGPIVDRTFEIRFLDPGVQAYAFTFG